jgi:dTDP-glucose 4,6-dehydratase
MKKILLTGACGFIFSNFLRYALEHTDYEIVSVDRLVETYNFNNILKGQPLHIADIADHHVMDKIFRLEKPDIVIHSAAESNVDVSLRNALPFQHSNVLGTQVMVDMALKYGVERFVYISTDEVYGQLKSLLDASWTEEYCPSPRNPYSASKYSGELIVRAAHEAHGLQYNITRCSNNYGPRQNPRNLVPKIITSNFANVPVPIHGTGQQHREWLYVEDNCTAVLKIIEAAPLNETYNIGSGIETSNMKMVDLISRKMNVSANVEHVKDRAAHDQRYSVDISKIEKLGWAPHTTFEKGLEQTINWYTENKHLYLV